ncbi:heterokaryon incompatibility protein [Colletotrichum karsti]|uniref:Heterokaryon incompatibility protein n=1 Tax=Colletotrichum karsti TaxID=1095194 RepID=A0A9P6I940_9PEZI|nr:heterokaryon incompatibility protein [Colletotrichum karsti]KAF9878017.1 heterokaryon incompatibility protein [Colletotrichum karsti]
MIYSDDPLSRLIRRRPLERDVKSKKALDAAKRLYTECKDSHDACQFSRDSVLPSRVLDVGTAAEPSLKVFVNDTEQRGDYLALSYCWGGPQKGLLRRNTLGKMSSDAGIREKDLQKSVRDAVQVTRMLGFRYLWVDAFCIIQDCNKDKGKEIGRMATIYKNAALTIAAGTAARAADGFLGGKGSYLPEERAVVRTAGGRGTVYLRSGGYEPSHTLDSRGWVLQEFLLSSRLLIFSEYELLWQCKKTDLRGVNEGGLEYLQLLEGFPWTSFNEDNAGLFGSSDEEKKYLWKTVVEQYTRRLLSDPEDRLNALRGITRELEVLWEDSNYFGLWNRWFVELLAWYRPPDIHWQEKTKAGEKLTEKVQEQRSMSLAPSWSWASLNQTVMYKGYFIDEDARLKAVDVMGTRASRHVALSCRILRDEDIFSDELLEEDGDNDGEDKGIEECIDLKTIDEVGEKETEYLLLGTVMLEGATVGVGLMVVEAGDGFYKRVGLVRFMDMEVWKVHRVTSVSALLSAAAEQTDGFGNGGMEHAAASEKEGTGRRRWEM